MVPVSRLELAFPRARELSTQAAQKREDSNEDQPGDITYLGSERPAIYCTSDPAGKEVDNASIDSLC